MYFLHFSTVTVSPKPNYSSNQFFLCFRLYLPTIKFFEFMPHVLDWIEVRGLCWCSPPVDSILSEILYCISRGTFVCLGSLSCIKRCVSGNFSSINGSKVSSMMSQNKNPIKHTDAGSSPLTYSCPDMDLHWMFWPNEVKHYVRVYYTNTRTFIYDRGNLLRLRLRCMPHFSAAKSSVVLKLDGTFV